METYKHYSTSVGNNLKTIQITTKYRYKMMQKDKIKVFCRIAIEEACKKHKIEILIIKVMEEHVHLIAIASQTKNKKILEYGCGTADISFLAKKCGAKEVHALDLPSKTLDFAKFKLKKLLIDLNKIRFIKAPKNINKLNLRKNYYDIVAAEDVFEHVNSPEKHAKKIYDALKEGGSLFFSTEYVHSEFHPMHLKINEKFNGASWLYVLENLGFKIISPCQAIKS